MKVCFTHKNKITPDIQTDRERKTDRQTYRLTDIQTYRLTDIQTYSWTRNEVN